MLRISLFIISLILITSCRDDNNPLSSHENVELLNSTSKISITSPTKYELWRQNNFYDIKWSPSSNSGFVMLELVKKGKTRHVIARQAKNTGTFQWLIPPNLINSNMYYIKITKLNQPNFSYRSEEFSIRDF